MTGYTSHILLWKVDGSLGIYHWVDCWFCIRYSIRQLQDLCAVIETRSKTCSMDYNDLFN